MTEKLSSNPDTQRQMQAVEENLLRIRETIRKAAEASGRKEEDIRLLAATKTVPAEVINHAVSLGVTYIRENKVQELCAKYDALDTDHCHVHFIGHLQTNKVRQVVDKVEMIQSVDSLKLAKEISKACLARQKTMDVLIEVNIGREENKSGVLPEGLIQLLEEVSTLPAISVRGLMAIPPASGKITETREYFSDMYKSFLDIRARKLDNVTMEFLSLGMSADYAEAIAQGANLVRIGSALFGERVYPSKET